ncbi:MAG: MauE/DoxX family redox-associated membrane protein [Pyrinomonadaceae bacterium]
MEIILLLIRIILFGIFGVAGVGKLLDLEGSEKAVKDFGAPAELAKTLAIALPLAEIVFAVCLLFVETSWLGAIGALILLLTFIGGMLVQMAQGKAPDCHCFGVIHSEPVSKKILIRNIIFAILAFFLILSGKDNQGFSLFDSTNNNTQGNFMSFILGLATVGLLAAVVFYLKKISEQQTQIMRRIEIFEITALESGGEIKREGITQPDGGLLIGTPSPDFSLPDINDKIVNSAQLFAPGKPILFLFVSANCSPCAALLPEIESWQNELKDKMEFVFVSSGNVEENLRKFAGSNLKQILLQKDREVALSFGTQWTPAAVLVNADGTVASKPAVGDQQIRQLIEKIKTNIDISEKLLIAGTNEDDAQKAKLGMYLPEFSLNDVFDKNITSQSVLGKKTLITFWSATCGFCEQMLDDLRQWDKTKGMDEPNLLVFSEGEPEQLKTYGLNSSIILDTGRKVSKELGMQGTPSAILINEDGKIVSETAVGAEQIWALLGKRS